MRTLEALRAPIAPLPPAGEQVIFEAPNLRTEKASVEPQPPHKVHPTLMASFRHAAAALKLARLEQRLNGSTEDDGVIALDPATLGGVDYQLSGIFSHDPKDNHIYQVSVTLERDSEPAGSVTANYEPHGLMQSFEYSDETGTPVVNRAAQATFGKLLRRVASTVVH